MSRYSQSFYPNHECRLFDPAETALRHGNVCLGIGKIVADAILHSPQMVTVEWPGLAPFAVPAANLIDHDDYRVGDRVKRCKRLLTVVDVQWHEADKLPPQFVLETGEVFAGFELEAAA